MTKIIASLLILGVTQAVHASIADQTPGSTSVILQCNSMVPFEEGAIPGQPDSDYYLTTIQITESGSNTLQLAVFTSEIYLGKIRERNDYGTYAVIKNNNGFFGEKVSLKRITPEILSLRGIGAPVNGGASHLGPLFFANDCIGLMN